jgi:integrase
MILTAMTNPNDTQMAGAKRTGKLNSISKDGKWKTFLSHAGLMQYVPSGQFFARAKVDGIVKRASLDTDVFTTAKDRLRAKINELKAAKPNAVAETFKDARLLYETDLDNDYTLAEASRQYRKARIAALLKSWPSLDGMKLERISETRCREWAKGFAEQFDEQNFNNTLGTLRGIIARGGIGHDANPAFKIKRLGVKPTVLQLPEPEQFEKLVETIENAGSGYSHDCADLVRFLAFSGCRISEANQVTWGDVDFERGEIKVRNAKRSRTSNAHPTRQVPIIPAMRQLLERMQREQNPKLTDRVCKVGECEKALTAACGIKDGERLKRTKRGKEVLLGIGIERITHHDLRHLFATRCIEAGVDIPTVSRWLGHVDGGALAMKVYGHLRRTHSQAQAQLVTFGTPALPSNAIPMPQSAVAE